MLRHRIVAAALLAASPFFSAAFAQSIALDKEDATVWAQLQAVSGTIVGATHGVVHVGEDEHPFTAQDGAFSVDLWLGPGSTEITACTTDGAVCTESLTFTLGFTPRPEVELRATVDGGTVTLLGEVIDNPNGGAITTAFSAEEGNPGGVSIIVVSDEEAVVTIPGDAPPGEYYFAWEVHDGSGESRTARTIVTVTDDGEVVPFVMEHDAAQWVDRATVYGIAPYYFVRYASNRFQAIRGKLPELAELGVNTLWLQPIYQTHGGGQAYDVTDFFSAWSSHGTENDLRELIDDAHDLGMRVLFDLVPNHSALQHPYAQDAIEHGPRSHYYDFYQREFDSVPYSQHYNSRQVGQMTFVYYFWNNLVNFNYHNAEARRHMIEASRYWVEEFNIDGYRVDVAWGPDARNPDFFKEWRLALKRIRPDLLLLGEDKATLSHVFDERFDAAYDWAPSQSWVSQWMWQAHYSENSNPTIFNHGQVTTRPTRLRDALTNYGNGWADGARVLRFMENNDTFRFLPTHDLERTHMVATMLYTLPGIPLMYNGQEVGYASHPYQTGTIFAENHPIQAIDHHGLFPFYQRLLALRDMFPSITGPNWEEVVVDPPNIGQRLFSYRRWLADENIFATLNLGTQSLSGVLNLPVDDMGLETGATYYVTDLMTGEYLTVQAGALAEWSVDIPGHTALLFAVSDEPLELPVSFEPSTGTQPVTLRLDQNYPNPFTASTNISFSVSEPGSVRLRVVDLLGREVALLVDEVVHAGEHRLQFDGRNLASGTYLFVLEAEGERRSRHMSLVR